MATCIVCNAYFDASSSTGAWCSRCDTNNRQWLNWRQHNTVERGGWHGVLAFTQPHSLLPLGIAAASICLGCLFTFTLWLDIKPGFRAIAWFLTPVVCMLLLYGVYEARMHIRQSEMLRRVRCGWRRGISAQTLAIVLPIAAVGIVLILIYALVRIETLWEFTKWLALVYAPEPGDNLPDRVLAVLPFVSMVGYVLLAIGFTASSSLILAQNYINRLNCFLPHPVFLQDEKLTQIVRREAEVELGRLDPVSTNVNVTTYVQVQGQIALHQLLLPPNVNMPIAAGTPLPPQVDLRVRAGHWVWDELMRTDDGGVEMKVARQEMYQLPKPADESSQLALPQVRYIVRANLWGRITTIKRDSEDKKK